MILGRLAPDPTASQPPPAEVEDFTAAAEEVPQIHAVVTEQIGRKVKVEGRWIFDFASCNYLGIDLEPEVMEAIPPALQKWGVHPSWTRAVASPGIYEDLEQALAELVGAPTTLVFPAVTLLHAGVLPLLAGPDGVILKDISAHRSIIEACRLAQTNGAEYLDFRHNDPADLEAKLARYPLEQTKIIAIDGVYSMSGEYPPLPEFARLARKYNAWVYMDDAHGIGVIGEEPSPAMPYGHKGNGIVRYYGLDYLQDRLIYVAGLSKSFSSFGAFITCHDLKMKNLFRSASTFIFSGPSPVASLASALAGLQLNQREGERWRSQIHQLTHRLIQGARQLGYEVINDNDFPIVCVVVGKTPDVIQACKILWEYGILITPALYPIVPKDKGLLRFSITAANTEEEIDRSLDALAAVRTRVWEPEYAGQH
jgi:7-keto-8-aminopelargonate synthetase-like enzyme